MEEFVAGWTPSSETLWFVGTTAVATYVALSFDSYLWRVAHDYKTQDPLIDRACPEACCGGEGCGPATRGGDDAATRSSGSKSTYWSMRTSWLFQISGVMLQLALIVCLILSTAYHFQDVTLAECADRATPTPTNFMPSISASIGDFRLQRWIWNSTIALTINFRAFTAVLFHAVYLPIAHVDGLCQLRLRAHVVAEACLLGLTVVSSREYLLLHQIFFSVFWLLSVGNAWLTCYINWSALTKCSRQEDQVLWLRLRLTLKWRLICGTTMTMASILALVFYFMHKFYCADYQYSMFALCEWTIVGSIVMFHWAEICDQRGLELAQVVNPSLVAKRKS